MNQIYVIIELKMKLPTDLKIEIDENFKSVTTNQNILIRAKINENIIDDLKKRPEIVDVWVDAHIEPFTF